MYVLLLVVLLGIVYLYMCYQRLWKHHPRSPPIIPGELPIIGHGHIFIKHRNDIWSYFKDIGEYTLENGGIAQFRVGAHISYVVTDPEAVGIIANKCLNKPYYYKFIMDALGNGLVTLNRDMWKIHHKLVMPAFSQQVLDTFLIEMNVQAQNLVSQLTTVAAKGPVIITEFLTEYILRIVCRTSLQMEAKDQHMIDNDYAKAIEEMANITIHRASNPLLHLPFLFKRTAMSRRLLELTRNNKKLLEPIIQKRRSDKAATECINNANDSVKGKFKPILDLLLHLSDKQYVLSDDEIMAHLNTFVAASYDTTSSALQTLLAVLGSHPDVQERVYKEIQDVFENDDESVTKHNMTKLVYLDAVIKEVLRVYNAIPFIARKIETDIVLPNYTLRAGSACVLLIYGLHRHSSWGPDVKQFKPERWLNPATLPTNPNVYAAFAVGKRMCIGKQYAMMSMKTALVHIVRKFHISSDISTLEWNYEVVLKPKKPLINLTLRS